MDKAKNLLSQAKGANSPGAMILKAVIAVVLVILLIKLGTKLYMRLKDWKGSKPWILKGTKSAKKRMIILQNPQKSSAINLGRSKNEEKGLEFSYCFWMFIDDWSYKYGQWKHVMHKGNDTSWPLRAPGVWLHPKKNILRIYQNSFKEIGEFVDIPNVPVSKWFLVSICVRQKNLDIFFNGNLVKRKLLDGLPRQNYGDLYINAFQGFSGYMSNIRYWDYYISYAEIRTHLLRGPSMMPCVDSAEMPPYLTPGWWTDN